MTEVQVHQNYSTTTVLCEENIQHLQIATGFPEETGKFNVKPKILFQPFRFSLDDSTKWYKYVDRFQRILNSTICRSTKRTPFELLIGTKMEQGDIRIKTYC
ncbi:hypothetical protein TNIN_435441 [Trichonephila inaurata madagascariensis]|uniref:Uncharacterized protein n=1 Tax=Trichonephila inaurata madagascariensis TaxID=2747483 RepID=A0A8X6WN25_9ARAC|nr:hypothetical protein TNIN_435441 [Trichonephila inaurata madagascariensis]